MTESTKEYRAYLARRLADCEVPGGLRDGLIHYVAERRPVGHFLTAVLENNLREAMARADSDSRAKLYQIVFFLYNYTPAPCWGSVQNVNEWLSETEKAPECWREGP